MTPRNWLAWLASAVSPLATACFGSPTPLAPGLHGSVGLPHHGTLTDSLELPVRGPGYERYRPRSNRYFGHPRLVAAIERAARAVELEAPGGALLRVGDLSSSHGGRISGHASHRSGRDVDFLFYTTTPQGVPVPCPGFVHFGPDGLAPDGSGGYVALDRERQWLFFRNILSDPEIEILWLFISRDLEALIIDHALAREEPTDLLWRAVQVMHQPRDSANHDDHVHLRIACNPEDRVAGCDAGGPGWPWVTQSSDAREAVDLDWLQDDDPPPPLP